MYGNNWWDTWDIINWEQDSDDRIRYLINRFHLEKVNFNMKYPRHGEYESPLYFAVVASASSDIIELLIKYGADPTLKIKTPWLYRVMGAWKDIRIMNGHYCTQPRPPMQAVVRQQMPYANLYQAS